MATITSAQVGNWSDTATWIGGVVPVSGDTAILNHSVTADVDIDGVTLPSQASTQLIINATGRNLSNITVTGNINNTNGFIRINNTTLLDIVNIGLNVDAPTGAVNRSVVRASSPVTINATINAIIADGVANLMLFEGNNTVVNATGVINSFGIGTGTLFISGGRDISLDWTGVVSGTATFCSATTNNWFSNLSIRGISDLSPLIPFSGFLNCNVSGVHNNHSGQAFRPRGLSDTLRVHAGEPLRLIFGNTANADANLYTADQLTGYPLASDLRLGVQAGPMGEIIGTLNPVNIDVQQLASDLLTEMNASALPIAEGLRDGMGASAAAIAAVGSIQAIP